MSDTNYNPPKPAPNTTPIVINSPPKPAVSTPKPQANLTPSSIRAANPPKRKRN